MRVYSHHSTSGRSGMICVPVWRSCRSRAWRMSCRRRATTRSASRTAAGEGPPRRFNCRSSSSPSAGIPTRYSLCAFGLPMLTIGHFAGQSFKSSANPKPIRRASLRAVMPEHSAGNAGASRYFLAERKPVPHGNSHGSTHTWLPVTSSKESVCAYAAVPVGGPALKKRKSTYSASASRESTHWATIVNGVKTRGLAGCVRPHPPGRILALKRFHSFHRFHTRG